MGAKIKIPEWIEKGPNDAEYKTYKMLGVISDLKKKLETGNLMEVLFTVDDTLDYLYRYDAIRITSDPDTTKEIIGGFDFPDLELVFSTKEEMDTNVIMDSIIDEAIDKFEDLYSDCREIWRTIEDGLTCNYVPSKPYFLNDGFVFIKTPNNLLHIYHFTKPSKYFTQDWRTFKMEHLATEKWSQEDYFIRIEEILSKKSDKIIFKIESKTETILENNALTVINQMIFSMLHRDYSF
jgi:hypothetical protein